MNAASGLPATPSDIRRRAITLVFQHCVGRTPSPGEVEVHSRHLAEGGDFAQFLIWISETPEARSFARSLHVMPEMSDGTFVQNLYEAVLGRGALSWEIAARVADLESGGVSRADLLAAFFSDHARIREVEAMTPVHQTSRGVPVLGVDGAVALDSWEEARRRVLSDPSAAAPRRSYTRLDRRGDAPPRVSALTSVYKGGAYMKAFLDNITAQEGFDEFCELVIVDADSPDRESEILAPYLERHRNILYKRLNVRVGIYEAWNIALEMSTGEYVTNTNLDDSRRRDSMLRQASTLDHLPFVDVVYQDFYYTYDPSLTFEQIERIGLRSQLPEVSAHNLMSFNSPHNAPMWRRALHAELGVFDPAYRSNGDQEFWMRCLAAGKTFFKIPDPHVAYFQNPAGMSTRPDTAGPAEHRRALLAHGRSLVPEAVTLSTPDFRRLVGQAVEPEAPPRSRYEDVQAALRSLAAGKPAIPAGGPTQEGATTGRPRLRLLVDAIVFATDPAGAKAWRPLLESLASNPELDLVVLDRGDAPRLKGALMLPFPSIAPDQAGPEDSILLQRVCDAYAAGVFLSTAHTTPLVTPVLRVGGIDDSGRYGPAGGTSRADSEAEIAGLLALQSVEAADGASAVVAWAQRLARALTPQHRDFLSEWRRLRLLQAAVDTKWTPPSPSERSVRSEPLSEPPAATPPFEESSSVPTVERGSAGGVAPSADDGLRVALAEWQDRVRRMEASRSWRWTRWMRAAGDFLRSARGR